MKNLILYCLIFLGFVACKNPFNNSSSEESPADFSIQNTENGKVLLRLKPEFGEKTAMQMKVELKPSGMMVPLNSTIIADLNMKVANAADSTTTYHIDFQRMRMNASIMGAKINYDSQGDNSNIPSEIRNQVEPLLAKQVTMTMDTLAKVKSLEFNDKKSSGNIDLNALFIPLPDNAIGVGDSWSAVQDVQNVDNAELTYTVERISNTEVLIKVSQPNTENNTSKVDGQYLLDRKTGFTKDGVLNIKTEQGGQGMEIKIVVDSVDATLEDTKDDQNN